MALFPQVIEYIQINSDKYFDSIIVHIQISLISLLISFGIGVCGGLLANQYIKFEHKITTTFEILRIIPSLAIILLLITVLGTGSKVAVIALIILGIPPILMNTIAGFNAIPKHHLEVGEGMGMNKLSILLKVKIPLALPMILAGVKTSVIEIIASATLASKIGGGGLGDIIFTGLSLYRMDILLAGSIAVAILSIGLGVVIDIFDRLILKYQYIK